MRGSLWRHPDLVRLTYGALTGLVLAHVGPEPCRILDVGSGLGYTALELARAGHDVTGVDVDHESVALAERAVRQATRRGERLELAYRVEPFPPTAPAADSYDCVLFCRVLHHVDDPAAASAYAARLLRPGGRVVCIDFAHDRLDRTGARWLAHQRLRLHGRGCWPEPVAATLPAEADRVSREWRADHEEEGLHPFGVMVEPLRRDFRLRRLTWHPYLFWDLAAAMRTSPAEEVSAARQLRDEEMAGLDARRLRGVLFATTGTLRR